MWLCVFSASSSESFQLRGSRRWWLEGCKNLTGCAIGEDIPSDASPEERAEQDAASLYEKLEKVVIPTYYQSCDAFLRIMRHAIALNASDFNTQRMVQEYVLRAYVF